MTPDELRQAYLDFFEKQGHAIVPSSSLVPENDPTTLFTGSGMQPMVPYLLGETHSKGTRIADSQKCFRSQDIEEVGDNRHTTFFEMLGNWSLGDYFKREQLRWFFTFLTEIVGLDPKRLYVTVFRGNPDIDIPRDDESVAIWKELFKEKSIEAKDVDNSEQNGLQGGRIFYYPEDKNWWSRAGEPKNMPVGEPGGPDSEVFFDFGEDKKFHEDSEWADQPCHVNCDCGRFLEVGNNVFMEYIKTEGGYELLPNKNVDFGGGFERILAAQIDDPDMFKTKLFEDLIKKIEDISGKEYEADEETTRSFRVIADHIRAAVMLASDGVLPSNKEQGYFVRRLLRRAIRYAKMIDIEQEFLADMVPVVADTYKKYYPNVAKQIETIQSAFTQEEKKFAKALHKGLKEIEKLDKITGQDAFRLYETYGFPFELTQEIAQEKGQDINIKEFERAKRAHADQSRTASEGKFKGGLADASQNTIKYHTATHLLHAALRQIVGDQVKQQGSNITNKRLRFDFSLDRALTDTEKQQVEKQVNDWIKANLPMTKATMPKDQALKSGAIAFFREKYPDEVSVYTIGVNKDGPAHDQKKGWISKELCGGPHVENTGEIGEIKLTKEQSAGAGVRRIYMELD